MSVLGEASLARVLQLCCGGEPRYVPSAVGANHAVGTDLSPTGETVPRFGTISETAQHEQCDRLPGFTHRKVAG